MTITSDLANFQTPRGAANDANPTTIKLAAGRSTTRDVSPTADSYEVTLHGDRSINQTGWGSDVPRWEKENERRRVAANGSRLETKRFFDHKTACHADTARRPSLRSFVGHDDARRIGLTRIGLSPYRPVAIDRGQITALHSTLQALAS